MANKACLKSAEQPVWMTAIRDVLPLCVAVLPWGILCGSLGLQMGLTPLQSQAMSLLVFAGAAQISGVSMMGAATGFTTLWGSTFVISARHMLYSANFRQYIMPMPLRWRLSLGFLLTDEMYALSATHTATYGYFDRRYALVNGAFFYLFWNAATFLGILAGTQLSGMAGLGLDFAIAATFIALVIPTVKDKPVLICVLVSAASMLVLTALQFSHALLAAAFCGMFAGFVSEGTTAGNKESGL